ncbi:MAG TPA: hypothetical protein VFI31_02860 [Pirellulales bacterium]|nr:hypothetical protein [Pirellulales bacterium]
MPSGSAPCYRCSTAISIALLALAVAAVQAQQRLTISAHESSTQPTLVCFSPDGNVLATNGDVKPKGPAGMRLWDAKTGKMLLDITTLNSRTTELANYNLGLYRYRLLLTERWREELGHCSSVAFTPDGMTLAWGTRGSLNTWNGRTGKITEHKATRVDKNVGFGDGLYESIAVSRDGLSVASVGTDYPFVVIFDMLTGKQRTYWQAVESGGMRALAFSPKGPYLAVIGCEDPRVHVWDLSTGKLRRSLGDAADDFRASTFSFDGKRLAAAGKKIRAWNWLGNEEIGPLDGFENGGQCAAFLPKSAVLLAGSRDGQLRSWDLAAERQVGSQLAHSGGNNRNIILNGKPITPAGGVTSLALSPDARQLATAGWDGNVKLWDVTQLVPQRPGSRPKAKNKK